MYAHVELVVGLVAAALPLLMIMGIVWITRLAGRPIRHIPLRYSRELTRPTQRHDWPEAPPRGITSRDTASERASAGADLVAGDRLRVAERAPAEQTRRPVG